MFLAKEHHLVNNALNIEQGHMNYWYFSSLYPPKHGSDHKAKCS